MTRYQRPGCNIKARSYTKRLLGKIASFEDILKFSEIHHRLDMSLPQAVQLVKMGSAARMICDLVGMKKAKEQLFMIAIMKLGLVQQRDTAFPQPYVDSCNFTVLGPPGVGKTSLLRAFAELLHAGGALRLPTVSIVSRNDLVGQYLGATAHKTTEVVNKSLGGLLVIDEVYSISGKNDMFAREAIDTLTYLIDLHKADLLVAIAGYEKEVEIDFLNQNKGMKRRFLFSICLQPYSTTELAEIFVLECNKRGWTLETGVRDLVEKTAVTFKNHASDCVALVTKISLITSHRRWLSHDSRALHVHTADVARAISEFSPVSQDTCDRAFLSMYT